MKSNSSTRGREKQRAIRRAIGILRRSGWRAVVAFGVDRFYRRPLERDYQDWLSRFDRISVRDRQRIRASIIHWVRPPVISVVLIDLDSVNLDVHKATATVNSVRQQLYPFWELCICCNNASGTLWQTLTALSHMDARIRLSVRPHDNKVARANNALSLGTGSYVAILRCNDLLAEDALYWVAKTIQRNPRVQMMNTDEDEFDQLGTRRNVQFKTQWNPALMFSRDGFGYLGVFARQLLEDVGGFRPELRAASYYDLVLRCANHTPVARIEHIPFVLYHSDAAARIRQSPSGVAQAPNEDVRRDERQAIEDQLHRQKLYASVRPLGDEGFQVAYAPLSPAPLVSILIGSTGERRLLEPCLRSLMGKSTYPNFEVLLLMKESQRMTADVRQLIDDFNRDPRLRVLTYPDRPFNYSWVNNWGADFASGDLLCFLNDDTEVMTIDWMECLVARTALPGVAAAGAMLYYPNDTIQHAGVILGLGGIAGHACHGMSKQCRGYLDRARLEQDVSCVTAACMVMRKSIFLEVGGFDEALPIAFNDVDLCLRIRNAGWRIIWTPLVKLYHHESASVGQPRAPNRQQEFATAVKLMRSRWGAVLVADPYYSPNLSLRLAFNLAFPPRVSKRGLLEVSSREA